MIFFFWGGGTTVSNYFTKDFTSYKIVFLGGGRGGGRSGVARLGDFFTKNPNLKKSGTGRGGLG